MDFGKAPPPTHIPSTSPLRASIVHPPGRIYRHARSVHDVDVPHVGFVPGANQGGVYEIALHRGVGAVSIQKSVFLRWQDDRRDFRTLTPSQRDGLILICSLGWMDRSKRAVLLYPVWLIQQGSSLADQALG